MRHRLGLRATREMIYIPYNSDKGDCFCSLDGVLARDEMVEQELGVDEGYICDRCGRKYVEGIHMSNNYWPGNQTIPRRYFVEVKSGDAFSRSLNTFGAL